MRMGRGRPGGSPPGWGFWARLELLPVDLRDLQPGLVPTGSVVPPSSLPLPQMLPTGPGPAGPGLTHEEDEDEAGQRQGGAAADHVDEEAEERVEQQRGPEQPVDERPGPPRGHHGRPGEGARAGVLLLEGVLRAEGRLTSRPRAPHPFPGASALPAMRPGGPLGRNLLNPVNGQGGGGLPARLKYPNILPGPTARSPSKEHLRPCLAGSPRRGPVLQGAEFSRKQASIHPNLIP